MATAAAARHAPAPAGPPRPRPHPGPPPPAPGPPAPSGGAGAAIRFAKAQLGEPYRWGATGPGSWDCSGLTMGAWALGGRSLPHYSVAQYDAGTRISVERRPRPGDLLFWTSNGRPSGIHHVALYLGGGSFIEAPHTGANVPLQLDLLLVPGLRGAACTTAWRRVKRGSMRPWPTTLPSMSPR